MSLFSETGQKQLEFFQGDFNVLKLLSILESDLKFISKFLPRPTLKVGEYPTNVYCRDEAGDKRWADLKARVVEHNIRL